MPVSAKKYGDVGQKDRTKNPRKSRESYVNAGSPGNKMEEYLDIPVKNMKSASTEITAAGMSPGVIGSIASRKENSNRGGDGELSSLQEWERKQF